MEEKSLPSSACYQCHRVLDAATPIGEDESVPTPGSLSFCISCGAMMVFDDHLHLRIPTKEERQLFQQDERISRLNMAVQSALSKTKDTH